MNELLSAWDYTDVEFRIHMERHHRLVGFITREEHEALHEHVLPDSQAHVHQKRYDDKVLVVCAETMDWQVFHRHICLRHREFDGEVASVRRHEESHLLIPAILGHYHQEMPALDAAQRAG